MAHERPAANERAAFDPFDALAGDVPPRDQRDLMERQFFSLAKPQRVTPMLYQPGEVRLQVHPVPEHGMATSRDADLLICAPNQIRAAQDCGFPTSHFFRVTLDQLLIGIGRATGDREYQLLKGALTCLQSIVIRTTIRHGEHWRRYQISWINQWEELTTRSGRCDGAAFVLTEWRYEGVLDRRLVLAIDPAHFALSGGIERWHTVARKHAGRQQDGWRFELRHLRAKNASPARFSGFAPDIHRIVAGQPLAGYLLPLDGHDDDQELIVTRPVDRPRMSPAAVGTSGASVLRLQAHTLPSSQTRDYESGAPRDSKSQSKFSVAGEATPVGKARNGSARCRERAP